MRAAYYERNGAAHEVLQLGEVETPRPGAGEVRIKLASSGVNPSDVKSRAGTTRKITFPRVIPHSDGAGVIDMVGDGVPASRVGERVWTWNAQWKRPFGTCAQHVVLPAAMAVRLPDHIGFADGACLGIPAMTAYHAVAVADSWAGSTLLVSGGAGSVGNYAIQFAKARGAVVITTVSSPEKAEVATRAGADHVIDYRRDNVGERVMELTDNAGVDAMIELDLTANAHLIPAVLSPRGSVVVYGTRPEVQLPAHWMLVNAVTLKFIFVYELTPDEREAAVSTITRLMDEKKLVHNVALTLPLNDIVAAHEAVEQGKTTGNVVVEI
jgi:NADPH2:quinone reductase